MTTVRHLGVHLDTELSMRMHISKTTQTCFFHLRRLRQVQRLLGRDVTANLVVCAFVLSRLDCGSALIAGLLYATTAPLQRVLNAAMRLVYGLRPRDHVSAATIELHWLPVEARIQFKLCLLVHHTVIGNAFQHTLPISCSRSLLSHLEELSCIRPQGLTSKFQEHV